MSDGPRASGYFFSSSTTSASITSPVVCRRRRARRPAPPPAAPGATRAPALALVHRLGRLVLRRVERLHASRFIAATSFFSIAFFSSSIADSIGCRSAGADLVARFLQHLLGRVDRLVGLVARLDLLLALLVLVGVRLGLAHHPIDLVLREAARRGDRDLLLLAGRLVLRRHVDDAVGVDVEGDLDLRHAARRRRKAVRWNLPSVRLSRAIGRSPCSTCTSTLVWLSAAVENVSLFRVGIVVLRGISVVITPPSVSMPSDSGVTSSSSRSLTSPREHAGLDRRADRDDLVRVHALVRLLAEQLLHDLLHLRDARRAADEHDLVDLASASTPGVGERLLASGRPSAAAGRRRAARTSRASASSTRCFGPVASAVMNGRLISVSITRRELHLRLLRRFLQALQRHPVLAEIDALLLLELAR